MLYAVWLISDDPPVLKGIYSTHDKAFEALKSMEKIGIKSSHFKYIKPDLQISEVYDVDDKEWLCSYK